MDININKGEYVRAIVDAIEHACEENNYELVKFEIEF